MAALFLLRPHLQGVCRSVLEIAKHMLPDYDLRPSFQSER